MSVATKNIAVFGSTGSIGTSALEVIAGSQGRLRAFALSAHTRLHRLMEQARRFQPRWVVATDESAARAFDWSALPAGTELLIGAERLQQVAADEEVRDSRARGLHSRPRKRWPWRIRKRW
jgi:1-deoxy-D-xylulose-5-phosphate reductoisomerase